MVSMFQHGAITTNANVAFVTVKPQFIFVVLANVSLASVILHIA